MLRPLILLAEGQAEQRAIYRTVLEHTEYRVLEARDGEQVVRMARIVRPKLIIMDLWMPEIDGWEAIRILKEDPVTRDIAVVAIAAAFVSDDCSRAVDAGFASYLCQPASPSEVVAEVGRLLASAPAGAGASAGTTQPGS